MSMTVTPSLIEIPTVITTHQNSDFDALAAAVGASLLYPGARIVFGGSLNPNVREFVSLYGENLPIMNLRLIDQSKIRQLIMVDTADPERIGELGNLVYRPDVEVVVFDHHSGEHVERPAFVKGENWVLSSDGSSAASLLHLLLERGVEISQLAATIFALGIHEDTGSLTFPRTTIRDAEMLAAAMRLGATQALIERFLRSALAADQREVLMRMVDAVQVRRVQGIDVHTAALEIPNYVDGLSVIAHKLMDLLNAEILIQAVCMEGRIFVTARSRAGSVDVGALLRAVGGGGHAQAASALIRDADPQSVLDRILTALDRTKLGLAVQKAGEIMSRPVRFVDADTPVTEALVTAQRYGHSGTCVRSDGDMVGIVARRDLDKAMRHGLGHAPVKGVMTRNIIFARASTTLDGLRRIMVEGNIGRVPVVSDHAYEQAQAEARAGVDDVIGIVTRTDVLAAYQGRWEKEQLLAPEPQVCRLGELADHPFFGHLFRVCSALSEDFAGVYLVGGFVRDLLLEKPNSDVDIAVEGDGIAFAKRLAAQLGGRVRAHHKFKTAVVLLPSAVLGEAPVWLHDAGEPFHVDVATTRTEFYDYPAALPRVEHASIRQDLFRRDFTINAMAISLCGRDLGVVLDFFGGLRDLREGTIRVLHNLSFIEDPTRIFRAVRYENRFGFRMDEPTKAFAKSCVDMHLVGDLSSVRLREELIPLFSEADVSWTLNRLFELGVAREVHPRLATGAKTVELVSRMDALVTELGLRDEVISWRLRLTAVTRNMDHEELYMWLDKLKLKRGDSEVVRQGVVVGPVLAVRLAGEQITDWDIYRLLRKMPMEALVFASAGSTDAVAQSRIRRYVEDIRHRTISVGGDDLLAMGMKRGPAVGMVLEKLREMRVDGEVHGREAELAKARELVEVMG
jgi:tRNA nucleotidyltransferase (CCA-adding enzyme)